MWNIAKGVLWLLDGFFDILNNIWKYEFFNNKYVNMLFGGAIIVATSWLALKVIIELIMNHIVKNDGKGSPLTIYRGVVLCIVMIFLITPLFDFGHKVSTELTNAVVSVSGLKKDGGKNEGTISKALIRAMVYENGMKEKDIDYLVKHWKTIDITKSEGGIAGIGDEYVYSLNFFMLVVLSVLTIFLLFFVAIQMSKRVMEIALYKIIGPFCCTSLTNPQSKSFETWAKSTMGLFLITVVQFVSLGLLLNMFGSAVKDNGNITGLFLIIGALLFIIGTPTLVSSLLGQQSGLMSAFGDLQSLTALGQGTALGMSVAKSGLVGAAMVVPKGAGHVMNSVDKINSYRDAGSSTLGALGKAAGSSIKNAVTNPFKNAYSSVRNHQGEKKPQSENNSNENPFKSNTSNPYTNPYNMQYNSLRNQYQNSNDNNERRWY